MLDKPKVELPRLFWADDIELPNSSDYVVKNLIGRGDYTIAFGPSGAYKSFWLADLAMHVATGKTYYGLPVLQGAVLILALEGQRGFMNRILAQRMHRASDLPPGRLPLAVWTLPVDFCNGTNDVDAVIATIKHNFKMPPVLIGIDTQARAMGGGEENSTDGMGPYLNAVGRLTAVTGAAVVGVHHPGKDTQRGPRGHSSNYAGADNVVEFTRATNTPISLARAIKVKDGPEGWTLSFKLLPIELGRDADGDPITSCVVVPTDQRPTEKKEKPVRRNAVERIALDALKYALEEVGIAPPATEHIAARTVVTFTQWRRYAYQKGISPSESKSAKRMAFNRASEGLIAANQVGIWGDYCWLP